MSLIEESLKLNESKMKSFPDFRAKSISCEKILDELSRLVRLQDDGWEMFTSFKRVRIFCATQKYEKVKKERNFNIRKV